jgi:hypothetical protein
MSAARALSSWSARLLRAATVAARTCTTSHGVMPFGRVLRCLGGNNWCRHCQVQVNHYIACCGCNLSAMVLIDAMPAADPSANHYLQTTVVPGPSLTERASSSDPCTRDPREASSRSRPRVPGGPAHALPLPAPASPCEAGAGAAAGTRLPPAVALAPGTGTCCCCCCCCRWAAAATLMVAFLLSTCSLTRSPAPCRPAGEAAVREQAAVQVC